MRHRTPVRLKVRAVQTPTASAVCRTAGTATCVRMDTMSTATTSACRSPRPPHNATGSAHLAVPIMDLRSVTHRANRALNSSTTNARPATPTALWSPDVIGKVPAFVTASVWKASFLEIAAVNRVTCTVCPGVKFKVKADVTRSVSSATDLIDRRISRVFHVT